MQLSHLSTGPCDRDCVRETWDGPPQRLSELVTTCGAIGEGAMADLDDRWFYFSCGNRQGVTDSGLGLDSFGPHAFAVRQPPCTLPRSRCWARDVVPLFVAIAR